jgi:hypothetical protein
MAITNNEVLPGVSVDIADQRLRVTPSAPGPKLTILGTTTSLALAVNEPVAIDNTAKGLRLLRHTDGSPSELSLAVAEAIAAGAQNIEVIKISTVSGEVSSALTANARFDALEAAYDLLKIHDVDVVVPVSAWLDETGLSGTSTGGLTRSRGYGRQLADFCFNATRQGNSCIGVIGVRPLMSTARIESWTGAPSDLAGEFFDEPSLAYIQEWVKHLRSESGTYVNHTSETALDGYLAGSEEASYGVISTSYDLWARMDTNDSIAVDRNGVNVDGGGFISVTAMAVRARNDETQNLANKYSEPAQTSYNALSAGAVGYAALITRLSPEVATTNKTISGYVPARRMPASLAEDLLQARMVTLLDRSGASVVSSGVTGAHNGSDYTRSDFVRLTTRRITDAAVSLVKFQGDRFLGLPITAAHVNALEQAIATALDKMKPSGAVRSYTLDITSTADEQVLGEVSVELTLAVGHELRKIKTFVQLSKGESIT